MRPPECTKTLPFTDGSPTEAKNKNNHVSLDLQVLNKAMQHTRHVQAPITEDFITTFKDCKVFSNLDMNHGYHQFALDKDILKSLGRLTSGGINSQDLFDTKIARLFLEYQGVFNNRDDILVGDIN